MARTKEAVPAGDDVAPVNEVRLVGRVSGEAVVRELPSGDPVCSVRLVVDRAGSVTGSRQKVDTFDCSAWSARTRRTVSRWSPGDVVEVRGAVRRRFFRQGAAASSRVEIEVAEARLIRRAASA
ncbi:single-stranded DNA-binding protein [Nocardioides kribbensis]|uniref:single-stranded DNA-binding protein n=1 Tax=Nocardioides kribbensis TaxID=305517 RepID=UPI0032D9BE1E